MLVPLVLPLAAGAAAVPQLLLLTPRPSAPPTACACAACARGMHPTGVGSYERLSCPICRQQVTARQRIFL